MTAPGGRAAIRRAEPDDVPAIVALVHELADYERAADECTVTVEQLHTALFGPSPAVYAHVAVAAGEIVGTAVWFLNFSTWDGVHGIYLEDLYVRPQRRRGGEGRALIAALAKECVERGYSRLTWAVLNWNEPAIGFYRALSADPQDEWTTYRLSGPVLTAAARWADDR
ncbi:GNAT family N-acetyltransferase [Aldersonia sp. NBC_00410]|uniref:GNAT family N-acetyltransferase n=1 Tax=Aldersonia sp. NBC_00410 TaxID=2975954 RepID=UPI00225632EF|nr:GNAT family N-acetyltransferase [Aldersonia sp. NBC_00410]MCX5044571.1 GNAT family N-acetyltransferase [Aldersonia sp. NBC_00410]